MIPSSKNLITFVESDPSFTDVGVLQTNCRRSREEVYYQIPWLVQQFWYLPDISDLVGGGTQLQEKVVPHNPSSNVHVPQSRMLLTHRIFCRFGKPSVPSALPLIPVRASALDARCSSHGQTADNGFGEGMAILVHDFRHRRRTSSQISSHPLMVEKHPLSLIRDNRRERAARDFHHPLLPLPCGDDYDEPSVPPVVEYMDDRKESTKFLMSPPSPLVASL